MSLLPSSPEVSVENDPRVVGLDSEDADALMQALSSDTAREMLSALHAEPLPPSQLADQVDTTLQNAQYHLERLSDAGAIEVVGTAYSEKGREMDVYAPADRPLVIFAGQEEQASGIRAALSRLIGGLAALLFGAIAIQEVFGRGIRRLVAPLSGSGAGGAGSGGGGDAGDAPETATATGTETPAATDTPQPTATPSTETAGGNDVGIFSEATGTATSVDATADAGGDGGGTTATAEPATATPAPTPQSTATATEAVADAGAGPTATPTAANGTATETARTAADAAAAGEAALGLPPGVVFFLGGALVLGVAVALTYR